jgi:MFS family permease
MPESKSDAPTVDIVTSKDFSDSLNNPLNWSKPTKTCIVINISLLAATNTMCSTMVAPTLPQIMADFPSTTRDLAIFVVSIFQVGIAGGFILFPGLSELHGRSIIFNITNLLFVLFAIASALSTSLGMLLAFRFLLGLSASTAQCVGGGVIADMYRPQEQGRAISMISWGMLIGPLLGPSIGGAITHWKGWRAVCWAIAILVRFGRLFCGAR